MPDFVGRHTDRGDRPAAVNSVGQPHNPGARVIVVGELSAHPFDLYVIETVCVENAPAVSYPVSPLLAAACEYLR